MVGLLVVTSATELGSHAWWLDLFTHFHFHLLAASIVLAVSSIFVSRVSVFLCIIPLIIHAVTMYPYFIDQNARVDNPDLRILGWNLYHSNTRHDEVHAYIKDVNADLVVLAETTPEWLHALKPLSQIYPYVENAPDCDSIGCGMTVLSKFPFEYSEKKKLAYDTPPVIAVTVKLPGQENLLNVFGLHIRKAITPFGAAQQLEQIHNLGQYMKKFAGPKIIIGDLNSAPPSNTFRRILEATGTEQADYRRRATWMPVFGPFGLAIDHALVSKGVKASITSGLASGSDHLPILAAIRMD